MKGRCWCRSGAQAQVREPEWVPEWVPELERAWDRERRWGWRRRRCGRWRRCRLRRRCGCGRRRWGRCWRRAGAGAGAGGGDGGGLKSPPPPQATRLVALTRARTARGRGAGRIGARGGMSGSPEKRNGRTSFRLRRSRRRNGSSHPQMGPSPEHPAQRAAPGSLQGKARVPRDNSQRPSIEASRGKLPFGQGVQQVMQTRRNLAPQRGGVQHPSVRQLGEDAQQLRSFSSLSLVA